MNNERNIDRRSKWLRIIGIVLGLILLFFVDDFLIVILVRELDIFSLKPFIFSAIIVLLLCTNAFFAIAVYRILRKPPVSGTEGIIGKVGETLTPVHDEGSISLQGEIWNAISMNPIAKGARVEVISIDGLTLQVKEQGNK